MNHPASTSETAALGATCSLGVMAALTKLRLTSLVLLTTGAGFSLGARTPLDWARLGETLLATGLLAGGAAALNQYQERDLDALMERTRDRPLPAGAVTPRFALLFGTACSLAGLAWLAGRVNLLTGALGALTLVLYLFLYTPLKRVSTLNTIVGAVPGAMPPLIGWAAATDQLTLAAWSLFALQFFWQIPHFMAIAWLYRADYARAGLKMLPVVEPSGEQTGLQSVGHALGLLMVSLSALGLGLAGTTYLVGALGLGVLLLALAARFARRLGQREARWLFLGSVVYLPAVLALMVLDRVR